MSLRLFWHPISPPSRHVVAFCSLHNIQYESQIINMPEGACREPSYLQICPWGTVPFLQDGDLSLPESFAIIQYLAQKYRINSQWWPGDLKQRAKVFSYLHWHHGNTWMTFVDLLEELFLNPIYYNIPSDPEREQKKRKEVGKVLEFVDKTVVDGAFVAWTAEATICDIAFYNELYGMKFIELDLEPYEGIRRWKEKMEQFVVVQQMKKYVDDFIERMNNDN